MINHFAMCMSVRETWITQLTGFNIQLQKNTLDPVGLSGLGGGSGDLLFLTEIYKQIDTGDQGNYQVKAYERFLKWLHTHIDQ